MVRFRWAGACLLGLCSSALAAQEAVPDPAAVSLPAMTFGSDPAVAASDYKFFFFHQAGLSYQDAYADLADCHAQLPTGAVMPLPGFVPWVETAERERREAGTQYGLLGQAMIAVIAQKMERGQRNNRMRLCMDRRGYDRYAIDQAAYDAIWAGETAQQLAMQAKLASGPAPSAPKVTQ